MMPSTRSARPQEASTQLELFHPQSGKASTSQSPVAAVSLADALFKRWNIEAEREEIWGNLQRCINELGPLCQWVLPARLRLVAIVVQVIEALENAHVVTAVRRWMSKVLKQKHAQEVDALGLLSELPKCLEGAGSDLLNCTEQAELAAAPSHTLELDVVVAASSLSSHLAYQSLEDRLIRAIRGKEFQLAQSITKELDEFWKFLQTAVPDSCVERHPTELLHVSGGGNTQRDLQVHGLGLDDTLEDMFELGGEDEDLEDVATPSSQPSILKRKLAVGPDVDFPNRSTRRSKFLASSPSTVRTLPEQVVQAAASSPSQQGNRVSDIFTSAISIHHNDRVRWSTEDEEKLIAAYRLYGNQWDFIRKQCGLLQRTGVQIKDKIRNLKKYGKV